MRLFPFDVSIDTILYKWSKIKVFIIKFSLIIHFISASLIFCKHIANIFFKLFYFP